MKAGTGALEPPEHGGGAPTRVSKEAMLKTLENIAKEKRVYIDERILLDEEMI